jgi:flagellar biosynthesis protein FlhG
LGPLIGSHYDILGLEPTATFEHIERSYRYHIAIYAEASIATYSLLDPEERHRARMQLQEAYDTLKDPLRRRSYDVSLGLVPGPAPHSVNRDIPDATDTPAPARGTALSEPITGATLRLFREQSGIPLQKIAEKSKVGLRYLQYIEEDRHHDLPARVYLRGFVQEYARALGLDPGRTADSYLASLPKR